MLKILTKFLKEINQEKMIIKRFLSNTVSNGARSKITFAKQDELPFMPIPSLKDTADRFLNAIQPLSELSKDEFENEKAAALRFVKQAEGLQAELNRFADGIQTSYS